MNNEKNTTEKKEDIEAKKKEDEKKLLDEIGEQYLKAETAIKEVRDKNFTWDERDELFAGRYKDPNDKTKTILSSGELTTLAIDGSCRVMAQMSSGRFYNYNGKTSANMAMNLYFEHGVIPNANTGGPLLLKYRMVDMYSRSFPYIPAFIDWKVTDKYTGPDLILIHPRRFRPQPGKTAIEDMDYCFIDTEVSKEWLKKRDKGVWKNIDAVLKNAEDEGPGTPTDERSPEEVEKTKTGITLRHRFLSNGDWQVYAPFTKEDLLLVNEKDYYPGIPIALKMQYPSLDKLGGLSDFDRGHGTQRKIDSNDLLYQEGMEMSYKPPIVMDPEKVVLSSIVRKPSAKWFVKDGEVNAIKPQNVSPDGLATYQTTYQINKGRLMSIGADTDTGVATSVDPGFGKTPEAIRKQGARQGSRDAWDTFMMEIFITRVNTIMANMIAKKGINEYSFKLFGKSFKQIQEAYPKEDFAVFGADFATSGSASVDPKALEGEYIYICDEGSTLMKKDDTGVKLMGYVETYNKYPGIKESFAANGQTFDQGAAFKRAMLDDGIKDADKIIITNENPESVAGVGSDGATIKEGVIPPEVSENIPAEALADNQ